MRGSPRSGARAVRPLKDRLMDQVEFDTNGGCWLWTGATRRGGYGIVSAGRKGDGSLIATRAAFRCWCGPLADDEFVLHRCDTPACINPAHLRRGTHQDNMDDMAAKDRRSCGPRRVLSHEARAHIRRREMSVRAYAKLYGAPEVNIYKLLRRNP